MAGLADVYGKENVGVIHFDAHYDAGDARHGHPISHAQPVRRLVDDGHIFGRNFIQVGLRGSRPSASVDYMRMARDVLRLKYGLGRSHREIAGMLFREGA
ncbi:arginase family protein [Candidatus Palauibacter sp.]|uniref:arginase family protein n=1 Tax=Candidatus Palauibacter sp. TaxID=3101350 RepID=UPI003AF1EA7E